MPSHMPGHPWELCQAPDGVMEDWVKEGLPAYL